jgi:hypothetical protein
VGLGTEELLPIGRFARLSGLHQARMEGRAVETRWILAELDRLIDGEETLVPEQKDAVVRFALRIEEVPERHALVIGERVAQDEFPTAIPRDIEAGGAYLKEVGRASARPPFCVCPMPDESGLTDVEIGWLVDPNVPARPSVEAVTYPATRALVMRHVGPYSELGRSYRLMVEAMEENRLESAGSPCEVYETDPAQVPDPNDYVTEIIWPIGPAGELKSVPRRFKRPVD